jgi:hypothetical protein
MSEQHPPSGYVLPADLLAALVAFLAECPYGRVFQLVDALRGLEPLAAAPQGTPDLLEELQKTAAGASDGPDVGSAKVAKPTT